MITYIKKHRHNLIIILLTFFIISNLGFTFAFWASNISGNSVVSGANINIGTFVPTGYFGVSKNGDALKGWVAFKDIEPNKKYVQMEDIDYNNATITPLAQFNGTYNGNGFKISNFKISAGAANVGLFSINNGDISRIHIVNGQMDISNYGNNMNVGMIAGQNTENGIISKVSVAGTFKASLDNTGSGTGERTLTLNAGGVTGTNAGTLSRLSANVTMTTSVETKTNTGGFFGSTGYNSTSNHYVGGLVGNHTSNTTILESFATGNIVTTTKATAPDGWLNRVDGISNLYAGGLVGYSSTSNPTTNSFRTGTLTYTMSGDKQNRYLGPIVGSNVTVNNTYYVTLPTDNTNSQGTITTLSNLQNQSFLTNTVLFTPTEWTFVPSQYPVHSHKRN